MVAFRGDHRRIKSDARARDLLALLILVLSGAGAARLRKRGRDIQQL